MPDIREYLERDPDVIPVLQPLAGNNPFETRINGGMKMGDEAALDGASMQEGLMSRHEHRLTSASDHAPADRDRPGYR